MINGIVKRDGRVVMYDISKIKMAILKAMEACGTPDFEKADDVARSVENHFIAMGGNITPTVEEIQDRVEVRLMQSGLDAVAKKYILYRAARNNIRERNTSLMKIFDEITFSDALNSDVKRENANIDGDTPMGTMLKYGSDKPDLRNPLIIEDLTEFFAGVEFAAFKGKPVRGIVAPCAHQSKKFFEDSLKYALSIGMKGLGYLTLKDGAFKGPIDKFLTEEQRAHLIEMTKMKDGDTIFFISDGKTVVDSLAGGIRKWLGETLNLIDKNKFEFCYIVDFPMYELNPDTHKIDFTHNPFSMPQGGLEALETKDPLDIYAYQYDIVCNGVELSSGAVRNHNPEIMRKAFAIAGYGEEELAAKFGALYTAFQYGAPPHAGMAPGIDRMVMLLAEEDTIRDVIAFPLNGAAQDLMMGAPGEVTEEQLADVHIRIRDYNL